MLPGTAGIKTEWDSVSQLNWRHFPVLCGRSQRDKEEWIPASLGWTSGALFKCYGWCQHNRNGKRQEHVSKVANPTPHLSITSSAPVSALKSMPQCAVRSSMSVACAPPNACEQTVPDGDGSMQTGTECKTEGGGAEWEEVCRGRACCHTPARSCLPLLCHSHMLPPTPALLLLATTHLV